MKWQHADHRPEYLLVLDKSVVLTQRQSREYGFNERVARRTVYNIITDKFQTHGTILNRWKGNNSGRRRSGRNDGHIEQLEELIREGTPTSLGKMARVTSLFVPPSVGHKAKALLNITWRQPTCHAVSICSWGGSFWPVSQNPLLLKNAT
jgi:hypothetical protein